MSGYGTSEMSASSTGFWRWFGRSGLAGEADSEVALGSRESFALLDLFGDVAEGALATPAQSIQSIPSSELGVNP